MVMMQVALRVDVYDQATQSGAEKQLAQTGMRLQSSIAAVASLERDLKAADMKYTFLQEMKAYIADLCDMLQVKFAYSFE